MGNRSGSFLGCAVLVLCVGLGANAQTPPGYGTGLREPLGGQPAPGVKPSVKDLEEQVVYQRAFEAVIWSQPAVGIYGIRRGMFARGMKDNEIMAMSRPLTDRHELLTANNATPYIFGNSDLRQGPVVLEVPPASNKGVLYGQVVDAWQETIADVGPIGLDHGAGGKYLFLPPGYDKAIPQGFEIDRLFEIICSSQISADFPGLRSGLRADNHYWDQLCRVEICKGLAQLEA